MRKIGSLLFLAGLFIGARAAALENTFLVSDTVNYFEKVFAVRGRVAAWFVSNGGSTLNFSFPGKGSVSFHLVEPAPGTRYVDQAQVEPSGTALTAAQAAAYAQFVINDVARGANAACTPVRNDQDGINAFLVHSCVEKANPAAPPTEITSTIQSLNGRNLVFVQFAPKKR